MADRKRFNVKQKKFYNYPDPTYLNYQSNIPYSKYLVQKLLKSLNRSRNSLLEIGCGQGRFTLELSRYVKKLKAIDFSKKEIKLLSEFAEKESIKNIEVEVGDILNLEKTNDSEKYDHIVGFFILHHLPRYEYQKIVKNLNRLLHKGGRLSFIEPNNLYPFHLVEMMITKEMAWEIEKQIYTNYLGCFQTACKKEGLKIINLYKFGFFPPPLINKWPNITYLDSYFERIPILSQIMSPFVLVTAEKS